MRVRFAPSPTGQLHVGNARTALFNWLLARHEGGTFILRIEDTDVERSTKASEDAILEDLRWLGLDWSEGVEAGGGKGPYRQSERLDIYRRHAGELIASGGAYYCFCSPDLLEADRQAALQAGRPPMYSRRCRRVPAAEAARRVAGGEPAVIRLRVPAAREIVFEDLVRGRVRFDTAVIGDPVLVRSDGMPAYNFAVVVDDALMEISHVIRGEDHISNTPRQLLLYEAFGWTPPAFGHVSLVMGPDHSPLSKRHGATSVKEFRERGYLPEALANYLALLGWSPGDGEELLPIEELARRFTLDSVGRSASVFDVEKLAWVNRHYLRESPPSRLAALAVPYLRDAGWVSAPSPAARAYLERVLPLATGSVDRLEQVPSRLRFIFDYSPARALQDPALAAEVLSPPGRAVVEAFARELAGGARLHDRDAFRAAAARVRERTGQKGRALFHPIRIALTGEGEGVELDLAVPAIETGADLQADSGLGRIPAAGERAAAFARAVADRRDE
jgi:glutamyl-tRNA synthetase/nondiscriminating glutamyl-tRNA synthetase